MSSPSTLIEQHERYLHIQKQISKAIDNRDERLLAQLKPVSHTLFTQLEEARNTFVQSSDSDLAKNIPPQSSLVKLVKLMEQAQRQVQENENALNTWLGQMKTDQQHFRTSRTLITHRRI